MTKSNKEHRPKFIVVGNEKGGSGKSTTSIHIIVYLLKSGYRVGSLDIDARQGTLSRHLENRKRYSENSGGQIPLPKHRRIFDSKNDDRKSRNASDKSNLEQAILELWDRDYIVIDTPGNDTYLSRQGHSYADILITPLNDSFVDLDVLAKIEMDGTSYKFVPSVYSEMVWEQRRQRAQHNYPNLDWIVMRNRLSHVSAKNKKNIGETLKKMSERLHFRLSPGFGERVIFKELFPKGLTLLDINSSNTNIKMKMSHVAARQEVRNLFKTIGI